MFWLVPPEEMDIPIISFQFYIVASSARIHSITCRIPLCVTTVGEE